MMRKTDIDIVWVTHMPFINCVSGLQYEKQMSKIPIVCIETDI